MRPVLLTSAGLAFLLAAGAAQAATTPSQTGQTGTAAQSAQPMTAANQNVQQQFKRDLEAAGFTDVTIMPESFLVRAKDKQGRPVMMVINPDSVTAVVGQSGQASNAGNASSNTQPNQNTQTNK